MIAGTALDLAAALQQLSMQANCRDEVQRAMAALRALPADAPRRIASLVEALQAWQVFSAMIYPEDVFTGASDDPGALAIVKARRLTREALALAATEPVSK